MSHAIYIYLYIYNFTVSFIFSIVCKFVIICVLDLFLKCLSFKIFFS